MRVAPGRWSRLQLALVVAVVPAVFCSALLAVVAQGGIWQCAPQWNDEVLYWNEVALFHEVGWNGGYTVIDEVPAKAAWCHFGAHGPTYPALLGTLTRLTGLAQASIPVLQAALLFLASLAWAATCRLGRAQFWAAALVMATFWPLVLYWPTSMQETLHFAFAMLLAAAIGWQLRYPARGLPLAVSVVLILAASQVRVTWSLVAIPVLLIGVERPWRRPGVVRALLAVVLIGALFYTATLLYSPAPNFMQEVMVRAGQNPLGAVGMVLQHALKNLGRYVNPVRGTWFEIGLRGQVLLIFGAAAYHTLVSWRGGAANPQLRKNSLQALLTTQSIPLHNADPQRGHPAAFQFVLFNLAGIVGFVLAFYDIFQWRDYRVIAPHLLLSLLVLVGYGAERWLPGYAVIAVGLLLFLGGQFREFHQERCRDRTPEIERLAHDLAGVVQFLPDASGWDNTLLIYAPRIETPLLGLPRGIGLSPIYDWARVTWPPRSRYVLLTGAEAIELKAPQTLRKIATTELGEVYERQPPP